MARFTAILFGAILLLLTQLPGRPARACTTVCLARGEQVLVAKSYDFHVGHGLLIANPRGARKAALPLRPGIRPARWVSRHGSLTFNQFGRELPLGGMNTAGLVVEIMWLGATRHPPLAAGRETINELQLIQYLLDTCATTAEAVQAARRLQVARVHGAVHYLLCDRAARCASVEYLEGRLVIHDGISLPERVLTNDPYAASLAFLRQHRGFGGKEPIPDGKASLHRFARAARAAHTFARGAAHTPDAVARALAVLDEVKLGDYSKWQIIYQPRQGKVHFRRADEAAVTTVDARAQDYACGTPVLVMDVQGTIGPKPRQGRRAFFPYTPALNRRLVQKSFAQLGAKLPPVALEQVARYPETVRCAGPAPAAPQPTHRTMRRPAPQPRVKPAEAPVVEILRGDRVEQRQLRPSADSKQ